MATSGGIQNQDTADVLCGICESQHITKCAGQSHGNCSNKSKIRKYLEVTDIVVKGPSYVNI
jgi:hypothetical protein